jgi:hypothetical protein
MCILLDECVDERLRHFFQEHDSHTARYAGFAGLSKRKQDVRDEMKRPCYTKDSSISICKRNEPFYLDPAYAAREE